MPSKRVEGEDDMTIFLQPVRLQASITLSVPLRPPGAALWRRAAAAAAAAGSGEGVPVVDSLVRL